MNWLVFVAINVLSDSSRIYTDNYISDVYFKGRGAMSQKYFYAIIYPLLGVLMAFCSGIDFSAAPAHVFVLFFISGLLTALAGIPYYKALESEDSTNLGIFIQLAPVLYLILGWAFLGDNISLLQLLAFVIILAAPLMIIFSTRKRSRKVKFHAFLYAFLYVLIDVIGNLIFVKESTPDLNFFSELALVFLGSGIGNLIIMLAMPKWRKRFNRVYKGSRGRVLLPLAFSCVVGVVKTITYRAALTFAPAVALASVAADSTEPIVIFFMGLILTLIWPKFGREKLDRKTILVHLAATVLVVVGIVLIQT